MLLYRTCFGLAIVKISADELPETQLPGVQDQPPPDMHETQHQPEQYQQQLGTQMYETQIPAQMPDMQQQFDMNFQAQLPGVQYQPPPDMHETQHQPEQYQQQLGTQMYETQIPAQMSEMQQQFDMNFQAQFPGVQYQLPPDMQMTNQQVPNMQMLYQQMPQVQVQPIQPRPDDGSDECKAQQAANLMHTNMFPLAEGHVYCAQAADQRWWDVVVTTRNCDGSYSVKVKDDVGTEWPVAQRAYFLDKPCTEFYRDVLVEEGLSQEEIRFTLQNQGFQEHEGQHEHAEQIVEMPIDVPGQKVGVQTEVKPSRWPVSDRKLPLKVVAAAAAAGAVPLVYGLSGS